MCVRAWIWWRALFWSPNHADIMQINADLINVICTTHQDALLAAHNGAAADVSRIMCPFYSISIRFATVSSLCTLRPSTLMPAPRLNKHKRCWPLDCSSRSGRLREEKSLTEYMRTYAETVCSAWCIIFREGEPVSLERRSKVTFTVEL